MLLSSQAASPHQGEGSAHWQSGVICLELKLAIELGKERQEETS